MGYNNSRTGYATVVSFWRVFVSSERAWPRTIRDLPAMVKPPKEQFYRPRVAAHSGHQIDLLDWHLSLDETPPACCYPDW
jgi:hypothetical protein